MNQTSKRVLQVNLLYFLPLLGMFVIALVQTSEWFTALADSLAQKTPLGSYTLTVIYHLIFLFLPAVLCFALNPDLRARLKWRKELSVIPFMAIGGVFMLMPLQLVWVVLLNALGLAQVATVSEAQLTTELVATFLVVGIMPGITEELMFRGSILPAYERRSKKLGIVISGLMFGLLHGQIHGIFSHVLLGMILGWLVSVADSLLAGMIYHITHNTVTLLVALMSMKMAENQAATATAAGDAIEALLEMPVISLVISGVFLLIICAGAGALFVLLGYYLYRCAKKRKASQGDMSPVLAPKDPEVAKERIAFWVLIGPLVVAALILAFNYGAEILLLLNMGAGAAIQ